MQYVMLKQNTKHMLIGEYKEKHFGSMGATQAAEWEREMLCEPQACEKEDEEEIKKQQGRTYSSYTLGFTSRQGYEQKASNSYIH